MPISGDDRKRTRLPRQCDEVVVSRVASDRWSVGGIDDLDRARFKGADERSGTVWWNAMGNVRPVEHVPELSEEHR